MIAPANPTHPHLRGSETPADRHTETSTSNTSVSGVVGRIAGSHPLVVLATAGIVGVAIGWAVKRRGDQ